MSVSSSMRRTVRVRARSPGGSPLWPAATSASGVRADGGGASRVPASGPRPSAPSAARPRYGAPPAEMGAGGGRSRPSRESPIGAALGRAPRRAAEPPPLGPAAAGRGGRHPRGVAAYRAPAGLRSVGPRERRSDASRRSVWPPLPDVRPDGARVRPARGVVPWPEECARRTSPIMYAQAG
jgi:hypothetical protein